MIFNKNWIVVDDISTTTNHNASLQKKNWIVNHNASLQNKDWIVVVDDISTTTNHNASLQNKNWIVVVDDISTTTNHNAHKHYKIPETFIVYHTNIVLHKLCVHRIITQSFTHKHSLFNTQVPHVPHSLA